MKPLREIIEQIQAYQLKMGYDYEVLTDEERMQALRDYTVALMMEQSEMLEEVSWKPWRDYDKQKPNPKIRKVALEWVDCLIFLVDQSLCLRLDPDTILWAFETKLKAINERTTSGYSKIRQNGKQ